MEWVGDGKRRQYGVSKDRGEGGSDDAEFDASFLFCFLNLSAAQDFRESRFPRVGHWIGWGYGGPGLILPGSVPQQDFRQMPWYLWEVVGRFFWLDIRQLGDSFTAGAILWCGSFSFPE